jgi:hypothetical protein
MLPRPADGIDYTSTDLRIIFDLSAFVEIDGPFVAPLNSIGLG